MEIISIEEITDEYIHDEDFYVYDLETDAGTFIAGGKNSGILLKNTDSCFVKLPLHESDYTSLEEFMQEIFKMAEECAKFCTKQFKYPIELAFEHVKFPLALYSKKRYAFKLWENPFKPYEFIKYKGIQLVRRDTCKYVKEKLNYAFELILNQRCIEDARKLAVSYIKEEIKTFLNGNVDFNKLILSKQLKAKYIVRKDKISRTCHWTDAQITQPHVRLAQQLRVINPADHPKPPDRVPYLFIEKKGNNLLQCDKVIHPANFDPLIHKIDSLYYFDHQLQKPIDMIYQFLVVDKKGNPATETLYKTLRISKLNQLAGQPEITTFFKPLQQSILQPIKFNPNCIVEIEDDDNDGDGGNGDGEDDGDDSDSDNYEISEDLFND